MLYTQRSSSARALTKAPVTIRYIVRLGRNNTNSTNAVHLIHRQKAAAHLECVSRKATRTKEMFTSDGKCDRSFVAQRKRDGPITHRSVDRNHAKLVSFLLAVFFACSPFVYRGLEASVCALVGVYGWRYTAGLRWNGLELGEQASRREQSDKAASRMLGYRGSEALWRSGSAMGP